MLYAVSEAAQDVSYEEMVRRQQLSEVVAKDPDVDNAVLRLALRLATPTTPAVSSSR